MTPDESLKLLIAGLTGILAFVGTWAGSRFSHSNEHRQWLRNEKMAACVDFIGEVDRILSDIRLASNRGIAERLAGDAERVSLTKLSLVCPGAVVEAAKALLRATTDTASLAAGRRVADAHDAEAWDVQLSTAFARAGIQKSRFMVESSQDLNSGLFHGLGIFRPAALSLLRMRLRRMDKKWA